MIENKNINLTRIEKIIITCGAITLFFISPYISSIFPFIAYVNLPGKIMGIELPASVLTILIPLLFRQMAPFFLPGLFVVLSIFSYRKNYIYFFTSLVSIIVFLDIVWIWHSWSGGIKHQGAYFAMIVAVENSICFLLIYACIALFYKFKNITLLFLAALLLCITLTFFAFPWLGEYI